MEQLTKVNFLHLAQKTIETLEKDKNNRMKLTTSQIRKLLAMANGIYISVNQKKKAHLVKIFKQEYNI